MTKNTRRELDKITAAFSSPNPFLRGYAQTSADILLRSAKTERAASEIRAVFAARGLPTIIQWL